MRVRRLYVGATDGRPDNETTLVYIKNKSRGMKITIVHSGSL